MSVTTAPPQQTPSTPRFRLSTWLSLLITYGVICLIIASQTPYFLTRENLLTIGSTLAIVGIVAIGETLVIISGGVDISVGSTAALTGVVASVLLLRVGIPSIWLCALIGFIAGCLVGVANGLLVTRIRINPLIATLGTFSIVRGLAFVLSGGMNNLLNDQAFQFIGRGYVSGIPFSLLLMIALYIIFIVIMHFTPFGRNLYAIGGSRDASRLAGIRVNLHIFAVYVICGALAAVGGIINVSQLANSAPTAAVGLEFAVIAAVVLGGTSLSGGKGTLIGTLIGVAILRTLDNGLVLMQVPSFYQEVARGVVLLLAVSIDAIRQRFGNRSERV